MITEPINNSNTNNDYVPGASVVTDYQLNGFRAAELSKSNPQTIEGFLDNAYRLFLKDQQFDEEGIRQRVAKIKSEVQQRRNRRGELNSELLSKQQFKDAKELEIQELEIEKIDIKNGGEEFEEDIIPFVIGAFITILLTFYLFVFYASSGYSAFYGVKPGSIGFINPDIFSDASSKGGGVIALILLFPMIFLGLGFLIHNSIETNKIREKKGERPSYLKIGCLLAITLLADVFIGYKISQAVHNNEFNAGVTTETWKFSMIYTDINFYLVIILGFVVYVIWGFLLNYVLSHHYLKSVSERVKLQLENISDRIGKKKEELSELTIAINNTTNTVAVLTDEINLKERDIIGYENGIIPVNVEHLRGKIGEFMGGYQTYTNNAFAAQHAEERVNEANRIYMAWMNNTVENLRHDN